MWQHMFFVLPLVLFAEAIKVPISNKEENTTEIIPVNDPDENPVYYTTNEANIDSYLVPPDPHKPEEALSDVKVTPATYLLPPPPQKHNNYYDPTESDTQSDWYPISHSLPQIQPGKLLSQRQPDDIPILFINNENGSESFEFEGNLRGGKSPNRERIMVPIPSRQLEPPLENAPSNYAVTGPSEQLQLPSVEENQQFNILPSDNYQLKTLTANHNFNPLLTKSVPINFRLKPLEPTLALHLTPPKLLAGKYKNPTKLYPKKYYGGFKPIPIPIAQFAEDTLLEVPKAKPVKPFIPILTVESEYLKPLDEKKIYLYEQAEQKRKLKDEEADTQAQLVFPTSTGEALSDVAIPEQEASETNYKDPGRNVYPAALRQAPPPTPQVDEHAPPPPGERTEFRMHGMKGPHSYQFGYDTGKGKNRQFRYEERDNDGHVRGHYGYMDKLGKLRVVNYDAHPELGFHADAPVEKES